MRSIFTAVGFSLLYASLYPVLSGGGVIYHYPPWSPPLAATYVAGGVLLQSWFCFGRKRTTARRSILPQVVAGVLYTTAIGFVPGSIYLS
jgi:hypothetical protein